MTFDEAGDMEFERDLSMTPAERVETVGECSIMSAVIRGDNDPEGIHRVCRIAMRARR